MTRIAPALLLLLLLLTAGGCVVTQRQDTPVMQKHITDSASGRDYWLYVPSYYNENRVWPLVVTLHGASTWDSSDCQMREWKYLAEAHGFIVAAVDVEASQLWFLLRSSWMKDLAADEKAVLAVMGELSDKYKIAKNKTLLTAFLEGGYPLYYIGLRHPDRFAALVGRDCYTDVEMMKSVMPDDGKQAEKLKKLPILVFWGRHGWGSLSSHGWDAFRALREAGCLETTHDEKRGGQLRRPGGAYRFWVPLLPPELRR